MLVQKEKSLWETERHNKINNYQWCCMLFFLVISISHFIQRYMLLLLKLLVYQHLKIKPPKGDLPYLKQQPRLFFLNKGVCIKILHVPPSRRVGQGFTLSYRNSCQPLLMCSQSLPSAFWSCPVWNSQGWKFSIYVLARHYDIDLLSQLGVNHPWCYLYQSKPNQWTK